MDLQPALVAVDLDGTLLTSTKEVSPRTRQALRRVRDDGGLVMLASGRPEHGLRHVAQRCGLGLDGLVLSACNGAVVVDAVSEEVLCERVLDRALVRRALDLVGDDPRMTVLSPRGDHFWTTRLDGFMVDHEGPANGMSVRLAPDLHLVDEPLHKLLVSAEPEVMAQRAPGLRTALAGLAETALSAPFYLEITPPGVDKGSGLRDCCAALGIDLARTVAFGDNENDIPMIRDAGVGVAMGNALPHVKECADEVTAGNDEDGIAVALYG